MTWAEKIIGLSPPIVTGAFLATTALGAALLELFPIGSGLFRLGFAVGALLSFSTIFLWTGALHTVSHVKLGSDPATRRQQSAAFTSAIVWTVLWCASTLILPMLSIAFLAVLPIITLCVGYFMLRMVWHTTSSLLKVEKSNHAFWTFVQILYFPIGVWFLRPRLERLVNLPHQPSPSAI